jgi:hypothetical protein
MKFYGIWKRKKTWKYFPVFSGLSALKDHQLVGKLVGLFRIVREARVSAAHRCA